MKLRNLLIAGVAVVALSACNATNQQKGTLIGAGAGGLLGSQIGSGSGKLIATGAGVLLGAMTGSAVGESMDRPAQTVVIQQAPAAGPASVCDQYTNEGARAACQRGAAKRAADEQRRLEAEAYNRGLGR